MNLNIQMIVALLSVMGEDAVRKMLTVPGVVCSKQALKNKDQASEMIAKRDAFVEATIDFAKEFANVDFD